jgi:hypothetical protein
LKSEEFFRQFAGGREEKAKEQMQGQVLIEWTYRIPPALRALYVIGPLVVLGAYYGYKYYKGAKFAVFDVFMAFFIFIFGSRLGGASRKYTLTTTGIYELRGTNSRALGRWEQFESCRREEKAIVLGRARGYPKALKIPCSDGGKLLTIVTYANDQISRRRWK